MTMPRLPQSFFFFAFLPEYGCVKCVCDPTTLDPETAEVKETALVVGSHRSLNAVPSEATQRCLDEAASDMLELACARLGAGDSEEQVEARIEQESLSLALLAQQRWNERHGYTHPDDRSGPAWHEHA